MKAYLPIFPDKDETQNLSLIREGRDLELLSSLLDDSIEIMTGTQLPEPPDYDVIVTGRPKPEYIAKSTRLKALIIPFAGLPDTTRELMLKYPHIAVHNLHFNADETAETAFALLLSAAKHIVPIDQKLRQGNWEPRYEKPSKSELLAGKQALILGFGAIGQRLARICRSIGMDVVALKRSLHPGSPSVGDVHLDLTSNIAEWLPKTKALLIALPLTPETEGLIGDEELSLLPDHAIVVNIGRAKIIAEEALFKHLRTRNLRAGLDVWYNYPDSGDHVAHTAPSKYPFHELNNVVMSPHRGGHSREMQDRRMAALAEMLNLCASGGTLPNIIDLERGY